jgi:hypothetical protein
MMSHPILRLLDLDRFQSVKLRKAARGSSAIDRFFS